jgi:hypothetical protein
VNYLKPLSISSKLSRLLLPSCLFLLFLTGCNQGSSEISNNIDTRISVDLGADFTVKTGENVRLTASIQKLEQSIISYQWIQTSGNHISQTADNNSYLEFVAPEENDSLEFEVIVIDSQGMEYTDSIIITVLSADESVQYTARLSWTAPSENEDGSSLTNLDGYKIYYGQSATNLNTLISVKAQQTSYDINNLNPDQSYFFCVKAYNSMGLESQCSDIVAITL